MPSVSRRITAFVNGTARLSLARRTSSTDSFAAACGACRCSRPDTRRGGAPRAPADRAYAPAACRACRSLVERADALHGSVGEPLRERALPFVEASGPRCERRGRRRRPARTRVTAPRTRRGARRRAAISGARAGTRRTPCAARLRAAPRGARARRRVASRRERALQTITRAARRRRRARRCAARARGRGSRALARRGQVELAVRRPDLLGVRGAVSGCGRTPARAARRRSAARRSRRTVRTPCRRRPRARARMPPARRSVRRRAPSVVRWIVTPVCVSPAMIARSIGAAPRQRGRSDGCTLSQSARSSSTSGMSNPYAATTTCRRGARCSRRASQAARRDPEPLGDVLGRRRASFRPRPRACRVA